MEARRPEVTERAHLRLVQQSFDHASTTYLPPAYHVVLCAARPQGAVLLAYRHVRRDGLPATDGSRLPRLVDTLGNEQHYTDLGALADQSDPRFAQLLARATR